MGIDWIFSGGFLTFERKDMGNFNTFGRKDMGNCDTFERKDMEESGMKF